MLGIDKIIGKLSVKIWLPIISIVWLVSGLFLYRSYFILLPAERARAWDFGYQQVAKLAEDSPQSHFVVDNGRSVPYEELLFFLKYPPEKYQKETNLVGKNYYGDVSFSGMAKFGNVKDECLNEILVGDNLSFSVNQIEEHKLTSVWEIKDYQHQTLLQAWRTNPKAKCRIESGKNR